MNEHQLKVFMTVAEKRSFSESAKTLHMAQPTVTSQVKSLENELDTQLFHRTTKRVELTEAGRILYRYGKEIVNSFDAAKKEIESLQHTVSGKLEIAASLTIGEYVLPKMLGKIKQKYPHIQLSMHIMNTEHIVEKIRARVLDIGLVEGVVDDVCSAQVRETGGFHGFTELPELPEEPVRVTLTVFDEAGEKLVHHTVESTPQPVHPNGFDGDSAGPQLRLDVAADGSVTPRG